MRKFLRLTFILGIFFLFGSLSRVEAHPGRTDGKGGHYCRTNCSIWGLEDGEYHYHYADGSYTNSKGERFNKDGKKIEKPVEEPVEEKPVFATGDWANENGSWKCLKSDNTFAKSEWVWLPVLGQKGLYNYKFFNSAGVNIAQFYREKIGGEVKYYLSQAGPDKDYYKGWWTNPENGLQYYFRTSTGSRVEGRQYIDGGWKFFRLNSGSQAFGWQYFSNSWLYFDENSGNQIVNKWAWLKLTNGTYNWKFFDNKGNNIAQFRKESGGVWLSQAGPSKDYYKGWWTDPSNGQRYYFRTTSGSRVEGRQHIDGYWYYFRSGSGTQAFGWQYVDGVWRYYDLNTGRER